jgi:hypothetical protein
MNRIFHYTNIESLALILKNKTIRFTRLDQVDDVTEAQTHAGVPFGKYTFVSCWTEDSVESIPQWHIYSQGMRGVRIELSRNPFRSLDFVVPEGSLEIEIAGQMKTPITFEESLGPTYFVLPNYVEKNFVAPVRYVPDVDAEYRKSVFVGQSANGTRQVTANDLPALARLKSEQWKFQRELRFVLQIVPRRRGEALSAVSGMLTGLDPEITHLDIPLDPFALDRLTVRTGPLCSVGARLCVEAIVSQWAPRARMETSALEGSIRAR